MSWHTHGGQRTSGLTLLLPGSLPSVKPRPPGLVACTFTHWVTFRALGFLRQGLMQLGLASDLLCSWTRLTPVLCPSLRAEIQVCTQSQLTMPTNSFFLSPQNHTQYIFKSHFNLINFCNFKIKSIITPLSRNTKKPSNHYLMSI